MIFSYIFLFNTRGGFGMFLEWEKYNWYIDLGFAIITLVIIQLLCNFNLKILAWILFGLLLLVNIYGIMNNKYILDIDMKILNIEKNDKINQFSAIKKLIKN
tara:strand:+ start:341 stop:646 length:306 start_codon:yes stop_codon:yes gene_type:complete